LYLKFLLPYTNFWSFSLLKTVLTGENSDALAPLCALCAPSSETSPRRPRSPALVFRAAVFPRGPDVEGHVRHLATVGRGPRTCLRTLSPSMHAKAARTKPLHRTPTSGTSSPCPVPHAP
jgi:hypothetical protein